jgi:hypothetical protein
MAAAKQQTIAEKLCAGVTVADLSRRLKMIGRLVFRECPYSCPLGW